MILNLGCGKLYPNVDPKLCFNVDLRPTPITHMLWDLNKTPYPFCDGAFTDCFMIDIIEHLDDIVKVVDEVHRVIRRDGILAIRTSYYKSEQSYADPTHKHFFNLNSFDFFDPETDFGGRYDHYTQRKWKVIEKGIDVNELCFKLQRRS